MAGTAPVIDTAAAVKAPVAPAVVAEPGAKLAAKAVPTPAPDTVSAPAATPVAKKKAVAKAAPKPAPKPIETVSAPAIAEAGTIPAKEVTDMETTINNAAQKAKTLFADTNAKTGKAIEDMNDFGKGNIAALVESGKIAAKGIEAMGQDAAEYGRSQFEGATAALKSLSGVKSPTDFFKLQSDYVRASFDSLVAQTSKNTETMLKLAGEIAQPIQNRVAVAVEKAKLAA